MLATEMHENIYLNVTKLAATVLPLGPGRIFPGFEADGQQCQPIARGWADRKTGTARCGERVCPSLPGGKVCAGVCEQASAAATSLPSPKGKDGICRIGSCALFPSTLRYSHSLSPSPFLPPPLFLSLFPSTGSSLSKAASF